jgi:hypothetical protein
MRTYHERWRFRHPSSDDFYAVVSEVAGRDMGSFFTQTTERPGILDYEVSLVRSEQADEPRGVFGAGDARTSVTKKQAREKERQADKAGRRPWRSTVIVRRRGEVTLPVSLRLEYEGGTNQTLELVEREGAGASVEQAGVLADARAGEPWRGRFKRLELTSERRLVSASVDPEHHLTLDVNRLNNARRASRMGAAARWGSRFGFWLQQLLALSGL